SSVEQPVSRVALVRLAEVLERLALSLRQLRRHVDAQAREQVAAPIALQLRRAAPLDAEQLAVGGPRRHLQRHAPVGGRGVDLGRGGGGIAPAARRAASSTVPGTSITRSSPRRSYSFDGSTRVTTKRSPAGAPPNPASPFPFSLIFVPSLTPAGMRTVYRFVRRSRPVPWHVGQGASTIVPFPRPTVPCCCSAKSPCQVATASATSALRQRLRAV